MVMPGNAFDSYARVKIEPSNLSKYDVFLFVEFKMRLL